MTKAITFSEADQALMIAVLKQIKVGKVDYGLLQRELNLPSKGAAQVRWSRFNSKLKKTGGSSPSNETSDTNITGSPKKSGGSPTKRTMAEEDMDVDITPRRRLPERVKRAKSFKVGESGDDEAGTFEDSGHGGTPSDAGEHGLETDVSEEEA